jgi:hypothetical protein
MAKSDLELVTGATLEREIHYRTGNWCKTRKFLYKKGDSLSRKNTPSACGN